MPQLLVPEMNRETWLTLAVEKFRPWFEEEDIQKPLPQVRVSVGWAKGVKSNTIGACYRDLAAEDKINQIYIMPTIDDAIQVLATLLHECVHAADNCESKHGKEFGRIARALGLTGKMTATVPDEDLTEVLEGFVKQLGPYPHSKLVVHGNRSGKTNNLLKLSCPDCDFWVRTTTKQMQKGMPTCACGCTMEEAF